jgi:hypothetical protein
MHTKERSFRRTAKGIFDDTIHTARSLAAEHPGARESYDRLLRQVWSKSTLLRPRGDCRLCNVGLYFLARHHADWLRPVETWQPPQAGPNRQFASLATHLFALYPVPVFMNGAWVLGSDAEKDWYKHLGRGYSIRTAPGLPLRLSRAMAHFFSQVPDHYSVNRALRWAQVRGLGGSEKLARAVVESRLGWSFDHEDFWVTVVDWFVAHPRMDLDKVWSIVDFIHHQKYVGREVFVAGAGMVQQAPPQPDYSIQGRTEASLVRQINDWYRVRGLDYVPTRVWSRSAIGEFRLIENSEHEDSVRCWTIQELLDSVQLILEGQALGHCARIYARACARGETTLWSLRLDKGRGPFRVLTIQVDPAERIILQVRGRCNRLMKPAERALLERWANEEGLQFADSL